MKFSSLPPSFLLIFIFSLSPRIFNICCRHGSEESFVCGEAFFWLNRLVLMEKNEMKFYEFILILMLTFYFVFIIDDSNCWMILIFFLRKEHSFCLPQI